MYYNPNLNIYFNNYIKTHSNNINSLHAYLNDEKYNKKMTYYSS